jgi:hypothetical protein
MSLKQWADNGWLRNHKTSQQEITNLLGIVERDLHDANSKGAISDDWKFGIAYNAALKLCTVLLYASGYKPEKSLAHYRTLQSLPLILGKVRAGDAEYLDNCRMKRNIVEYDYVGGASESDAEELIRFVSELKNETIEWLMQHHPKLIGGQKGNSGGK